MVLGRSKRPSPQTILYILFCILRPGSFGDHWRFGGLVIFHFSAIPFLTIFDSCAWFTFSWTPFFLLHLGGLRFGKVHIPTGFIEGRGEVLCQRLHRRGRGAAKYEGPHPSGVKQRAGSCERLLTDSMQGFYGIPWEKTMEKIWLSAWGSEGI